MNASKNRAGWSRRLRFDTPRRRATHLSVALLLILAGLTVALLNDATPTTSATSLETSGSFFALAESGTTLYAASDNGGSVLLEKSTDRGVDWTAAPVPYSVVAGGAPWTSAAVAVDGADLVLAAASGGPFTIPWGESDGTGSCAQNSTILLASSPDGGLSWNTTSLVTRNLTVTSLQAGIVGDSAAVAWLGQTTACSRSVGRVGVVTSVDAGRDWSSAEPVGAAGESIPVGEGLEMAPEDHGIMIAFGLTSSSNGTSELGLWSFAAGAAGGFERTAVLPAPTSWTLQGSTGTPAYLLTPTYLIPLTSAPYTALPFDQLQSDGSEVGLLPTVISVDPLGPGLLEIAATTSDDRGVDCWEFDTNAFTVSQNCHVSLGASLLGGNNSLPIVALIDGGGWWVAIGASGNYCGYACDATPGEVGANLTFPPAASAGYSVSTSVCVSGCSSAQGLEAYSFDSGSAATQGVLSAIAGLFLLAGLLWVVAGWLALRRGRSGERAAAPTAPGAPATSRFDQAERESVRRSYRGGLVVWALVWTPLALLALVAAPSGSPGGWAVAVVLLGVLGAGLSIPFLGTAHSRLRTLRGAVGREVLAGPRPEARSAALEHVERATVYDLASWVAGGVVVVVAGLGVFGPPPASLFVGGSGPVAIDPVWLALGVVTAAFVVLRALFHYELAQGAYLGAPAGPDGRDAVDRASLLRTQVGVALLPLNPFVGLLLGQALQPVFPGGPYLLTALFLPVTFLGLALLLGGFGPTLWSWPSDAKPEPPSAAPGAASAGPA